MTIQEIIRYLELMKEDHQPEGFIRTDNYNKGFNACADDVISRLTEYLKGEANETSSNYISSCNFDSKSRSD